MAQLALWAFIIKPRRQEHDIVVGRYDTIVEFNMDSKAECNQLNLAHVARKI